MSAGRPQKPRGPGFGGADSGLASVRPRRKWLRGSLIAMLVSVPVVVGLLFAHFVSRVTSFTMPADPRADAIVVLTGGTERVEHAVKLLSDGRAMRLLISGVHPGTTPRQIAMITAADMPLFSCCVDLDRAALNTEDNASETASWAKEHGFGSLILVTSAYHLPRARTELASVLPNVRIVPYPVYSSGLDLDNWYKSATTIRLLMREYVKYTLARLRLVVSEVRASIKF